MAISAEKPMAELSLVQAEQAIRLDLAAAFGLVAYFGWDDLIFTHLSTGVLGPENHSLINPYNLMFDEITASSLVRIDTQGKPVNDESQIVNPAGSVIHSALHMGREDAHTIIHLHTPAGQAVSAMSEGVLPHTQAGMIVAHDLAYHDYEGLATDLDERARLVEDLGNKNMMILRNHGTLAIGKCVADCFLRIYFLECACDAQVKMLSVGRDNLKSPPKGTPEKVATQSLTEGIAQITTRLTWPALLRKLDRIDPSYRD